MKRFLDVDFDPSEQEASTFDNTPPGTYRYSDIYPYRYTSLYFENSVVRLVTVEAPLWGMSWADVRRFASRRVDCLILDINVLYIDWFTGPHKHSVALISVPWEELLDVLQKGLDGKDAEAKRNGQVPKNCQNYGILIDGIASADLDSRRKFGPLDPNSSLGLRKLRKALTTALADATERKRRHGLKREEERREELRQQDIRRAELRQEQLRQQEVRRREERQEESRQQELRRHAERRQERIRELLETS